MRLRPLPFGFALLGLFLHPATTAAGQAAFPRMLDTYLAKAFADWEIPGAAVAVVKDGRVVHARGYGVRRMGTNDPVDEHTIFDTASLTKAFTAAAIASLVDEGRMAWDAPVRRYLPAIEFPDPYLTANITVRDLLSHRVGIRATNYAWYLSGVTRQRLLTLVDSMQVAAPFRTRLAYWNIGYAIAGEASAAAAGTSWEELVTGRLLEPLGMKRSSVDFDVVPAMGNVATGHALVGGVHQAIPRETQRRSTAPAGVLHSSVADLATWMRFHLGDGTWEGRRILSATVMNEMHGPHVTGPANAEFRASRQMKLFPAYGLGWQVFDYRGHLLLWHSGNGDGHIAYLALVPDLDLGIVVLANTWRAGTPLNAGLASRIVDHYLGGPTRDYSAESREGWARDRKRRLDAESALQAARRRDTTPRLPLAAYAGDYRDRLGLDVAVRLEADTLRLTIAGGEPATLVHWHDDQFRGRWQNPFHDEILSMFVTFGIDARGRVDRLLMAPYGEDVEALRTGP